MIMTDERAGSHFVVMMLATVMIPVRQNRLSVSGYKLC